MEVSARFATNDDIPVLVELYRRLEDEMTGLHPMWPLADGLPEPVEKALSQVLDDPNQHLVIGEIEGVPFGFIFGRIDLLLPQAPDAEIGSIRLIYTDQEAREVGLAEVMRNLVMERFRQRGITKFDAHVLPGHRLAKNFFEAGGFSARTIVMHHDDRPPERPGRDPRRL